MQSNRSGLFIKIRTSLNAIAIYKVRDTYRRTLSLRRAKNMRTCARPYLPILGLVSLSSPPYSDSASLREIIGMLALYQLLFPIPNNIRHNNDDEGFGGCPDVPPCLSRKKREIDTAARRTPTARLDPHRTSGGTHPLRDALR